MIGSGEYEGVAYISSPNPPPPASSSTSVLIPTQLPPSTINPSFSALSLRILVALGLEKSSSSSIVGEAALRFLVDADGVDFVVAVDGEGLFLSLVRADLPSKASESRFRFWYFCLCMFDVSGMVGGKRRCGDV